MNVKRNTIVAVCLLAALPLLLQAQELRLTPWTGGGSLTLNQQIAADTAIAKLPNRVYVLTRGALYVSNAVFASPAGWTLRIKANDSSTTKKPVVMLYPTGTGTSPWNPPGQLFQMAGNLEMRNIQLTGYYEPTDTNRWNMQGGLIQIPSTASGVNITIDSCILSNSNGNHIRTDGAPATIKITNTIFANMGYLGRSNLGAGKAIDLRASTVDTLVMTNNTFVNWLDRIIRHYPATSTGTSTGAIKYLKFDHNTLVNGSSYHGILSLGTVGDRAIITNNLFVDAFAMGNDSDATRQAEFIPSGEKDPYGNARMNWIFSFPNATTNWTISNNYYSVSDSGQAFYNQYASAGVTGEGAILTWHINSRLGADSSKAFTKIPLTFNKAPKLMTQLMRWYRSPSGGNKTKNTPGAWTYGTASDPNDFDRKGYLYLRDTLDLRYPTTSPAYTGGTGGQPVGSLNWFKIATAVHEAEELVPSGFALMQNYPNPFNPATSISFDLPKASAVSLAVYNVLGQKVASLVDGRMEAGHHTVRFDASRLASGMYLYRLATEKESAVRKMLLAK
ncbi:MAG: T9SS type A sorting domain-containing protein [Acidobacteriota bacterium]